MGVLVVKRTAVGLSDKAEAGEFTRAIHNKWGVGDSHCNNGINTSFTIPVGLRVAW